jgi:hypothetical protein
VYRLSGLVSSLITKLSFILPFLELSDDLETSMVPVGKTDIQPASEGDENQSCAEAVKSTSRPANF